jgi:hypothetical protein
MGAASSGHSSEVNAMNSIITGNVPAPDFYYPEPITYGGINDAKGCYLAIKDRKSKIRLYDIITNYPLEVIKSSYS